MKYFLFSVILFTFLSSCKDNQVNPPYYKGAPKFPQPPIGILAENIDYSLENKLSKTLNLKLDSAIHSIMKQTGLPAISATVMVPEQGTWQIDTGYVDLEKQIKVADNTIFYWASVSKLITGIVIQQLFNEQRLDLYDTLSNWYPDFQLADKITIYHLLHHTSGIYSFNSDSSLHQNPKYRTPEELLQIARAEKNLFRPGEYWSYSNTNYLLLALIAEKITNKSYAQLVQDLVAEPYGLTTLRALHPEKVPANLAFGHTNDKVTTRDYSVPVGAGNVVSSSYDMALLLQKLVTGEIFPLETVHSWLNDLYPMFDKGLYYGQGIMFYNLGEINPTVDLWIGHSGGTPDYNAILAYDVESRIIVAIAINDDTAAGSVANVLLKLI